MRKTNRKSLADHLVQTFLAEWNPFFNKARDLTDQMLELKQDLTLLRIKYGQAAIDEAISQSGKWIDAGIISLIGTSSSKAIKADNKLIRVEKIKKEGVKQRRSRTFKGVIRFGALKTKVVEIINNESLKADVSPFKFTILYIKSELKRQKVKFDPSHLRMILPKCITGLTVCGKQKRAGMPLNIYEATGRVGIKTYTKVVKTP